MGDHGHCGETSGEDSVEMRECFAAISRFESPTFNAQRPTLNSEDD
jgi:hypothetical protein